MRHSAIDLFNFVQCNTWKRNHQWKEHSCNYACCILIVFLDKNLLKTMLLKLRYMHGEPQKLLQPEACVLRHSDNS